MEEGGDVRKPTLRGLSRMAWLIVGGRLSASMPRTVCVPVAKI